MVLAARVGMSVGRAIASVVTALYLAAIGFSAVEIGALFVVVTVASGVMSSVIGLLADRWGRKPFLVAVPLLCAGAGVVYAESRATALLFCAAALGSFGRGMGASAGNVGPYQPAESALVADSVRGERRAAAFGRIAFASSLGALIGGLLTEIVHTSRHMTAAQATAAYRPAFLAAAALAVGAGLLALLIQEPQRPPERAGEARRTFRWPRRSWPVLWRFWMTNAVNGAAIGMFGPFVSYWLYRRYGATPGTIGLLFAIVNLGSLASALAAAPVARALGTIRAIIAVRAVGGALILPMVLSPTFWIAGACYILRMVLWWIGMPLRQSFIQDLAHPEERASVTALSNLPSQVTTAAGQGIAGYLFDEVSLSAPFELAAVFQFANAFLYAVFFARRPPRQEPDIGSEPLVPAAAELAGAGDVV